MESSSRKFGPPDWTSRGPRWHFHSTSRLCFSLFSSFAAFLKTTFLVSSDYIGGDAATAPAKERDVLLSISSHSLDGEPPGPPLGLVVRLTRWGPGAAYCTNGSQELALWRWFVIGKGNVLNKADNLMGVHLTGYTKCCNTSTSSFWSIHFS